jgi:cysteine desulfurase / selenocysteine lyase
MNNALRIYLDNAATSWPKPEAVYAAVDRYQREIGAPSGRGHSHAAEEVMRLVARTRGEIADLLGIDEPNRVIFTNSGTDSLNTAVLGIVRPGDHVVTTVCEHNSVLRPLRFLSDEANVAVTYVPCDSEGFVSPDDVRRALKPNTRLVAVIHGSNVTGAIQPVAEIGQIVHEHGAFFLIDAAQTLGEVPITMADCYADLIAAPGHKGLLGPLGTGLLCLAERVAQEMRPLRFGGTGTSSEDDRQPAELPQKYESGNLNVPGLMGLAAAVDFLRERGVTSHEQHHRQLAARLMEGLEGISGVKVYGPRNAKSRVSVVSFTLEGYDAQELAAVLEMSARVECRAGLHCAPRMHAALGTLERGGTVRLSPGWSTTVEEIDLTLTAIAQAATLAIR